MPKKAFQSFAAQGKDGVVCVISEDEVYADDHPFVKRWPDMFGELEDVVRIIPAVPPVETATAAPGETRRGPGRPRGS